MSFLTWRWLSMAERSVALGRGCRVRVLISMEGRHGQAAMSFSST
jgi:hypothetical protein